MSEKKHRRSTRPRSSRLQVHTLLTAFLCGFTITVLVGAAVLTATTTNAVTPQRDHVEHKARDCSRVTTAAAVLGDAAALYAAACG